MQQLYITYAVVGATVLVFAFAAGPIKRYLWVSELMLAVLVGVLIGPLGFDLLSLALWVEPQKFMEELARITVAISIMGIALRLPHHWVLDFRRPLAVILLLGMPMMWLVSSAAGWWLLQLPLLEAMLLGAIIVPTDPVVASSIATGEMAEKNIEPETRNLINAEAGMNDGLAYILVMLPVLLLDRPTGEALVHWVGTVAFAKVLGSIAAGLLSGYLLGMGLRKTQRWKSARRRSLFAISIALVVAGLGIAELLHGDGLLAVFAAGLAFNWQTEDDVGEQASNEDDTLKTFFDVPLFIAFGMILPVQAWLQTGWPLVLFAGAILGMRRLPVVMLLYRYLKLVPSLRQALFIGWFGPIGVAAIVYAAWADISEGYQQLWNLASFAVFASIIIHGITATPLTRLYGTKRWSADQSNTSRQDDHMP